MRLMRRGIFAVVCIGIVAAVVASIPIGHQGVVNVGTRFGTNGPGNGTFPKYKPFGVVGKWRMVFDDEFAGTSLGPDWSAGLRGDGTALETPTNPQDLAAYMSGAGHGRERRT